jgi:hypothetical protein
MSDNGESTIIYKKSDNRVHAEHDWSICPCRECTRYRAGDAYLAAKLEKQDAINYSTTPPFSFHETVRVNEFGYEYLDRGRLYGLVESCYNFGSEGSPNWALQIQWLKLSKDAPGILELTPVKEYDNRCLKIWHFVEKYGILFHVFRA